MTEELDLRNAYGSTIKRIKAQDGDKWELGMAALMWIGYAERPLRVDELCHALAVELGSPDFNVENVPSISTVVSYCQGLIVVDEGTSTVRLVNVTLQEYLSSDPEIFLVREPHSVMAEICLTYLNSKQVKHLSTAPSPDTHDTPFLEYCSVYWGVHAKRGPSTRVTSLALELLQGYDGHVSARLLLKQAKNLDLSSFGPNSRFSGLHCASFFGIVELVAALTEMGCCDINGRDFGGHTPLSWAARNGHEDMVKFLLEQKGVKPEISNNHGLTPLSYAIQYGHERVEKILLGREEANPGKLDYCEKTPRSCAIQNGREGLVGVLRCGKEVNKDIHDDGIQRIFSHAARHGHEGVVKNLLGREEVNPDKPDNVGRTPLSYAAQNGRERVVKILLGREEVNPDKTDFYGRTPLSYAALNGHEGVVDILLEREGINPDKSDHRGETPLSYAALYGHKGVVDILLGREGVNPEKPDNMGQTPLMLTFAQERVIARYGLTKQ